MKRYCDDRQKKQSKQKRSSELRMSKLPVQPQDLHYQDSHSHTLDSNFMQVCRQKLFQKQTNSLSKASLSSSIPSSIRFDRRQCVNYVNYMKRCTSTSEETSTTERSNRIDSQILFSPRVSKFASMQHQQVRHMNHQPEILLEHERIKKVVIGHYQERQFRLAIVTLRENQERELVQQIDRIRQESYQVPVVTSSMSSFPTISTHPKLSYHVTSLQQQNVYPMINDRDVVSTSHPDPQNIVDISPQVSNFDFLSSTMNNNVHHMNSLTTSIQRESSQEFEIVDNNKPSDSSLVTEIFNENDPRLRMYQFQNPEMYFDLPYVPLSLPVLIVQPIQDRYKLSDYQYLLRQQIEIFEASYDDISTHVRGRNKPISYGQVGIRCKHCAHVPICKRQKGSTYYPSNTQGIYQAAQNMSSTHLQGGVCDFMPTVIKVQFDYIVSNKHISNNANTGSHTSIGAGCSYWARSVSQLGFVDTDHGIRFIRTLCKNETKQK